MRVCVHTYALQVGGTHFPVHSSLLSSHSEVLNTLFNDCEASDGGSGGGGGVAQLDALPHRGPVVVRRMLERLYAQGGGGSGL
jgi:BTB/POZ domain